MFVTKYLYILSPNLFGFLYQCEDARSLQDQQGITWNAHAQTLCHEDKGSR